MNRLLYFLLIVFAPYVSAEPVEVTDSLGKTLRLAEPATNIISLAPHITENLYAAGAGDLISGVVSFSNFPEAARTKPRIGSYNNINLELILSLKPDLVIAWREGNQKQQVEKLINLGLKVYIDSPEKPEDIATSLLNYGKLSGRTSTAGRAASDFLRQYNQLSKTYSGREKVSVFYQSWNKPLITVNASQFIGQIITLCSGANIFGDLQTLSPKVSREAVIKRNPQVIITSGMGEARPDWLDEWKRWPFLRAVRQNSLYFIPPDIIQRQTPRMLDGATLLCEYLQKVRNK